MTNWTSFNCSSGGSMLDSIQHKREREKKQRRTMKAWKEAKNQYIHTHDRLKHIRYTASRTRMRIWSKGNRRDEIWYRSGSLLGITCMYCGFSLYSETIFVFLAAVYALALFHIGYMGFLVIFCVRSIFLITDRYNTWIIPIHECIGQQIAQFWSEFAELSTCFWV